MTGTTEEVQATALSAEEAKELAAWVGRLIEAEADLRQALMAPIDTREVVATADRRQRVLDHLGKWIRDRCDAPGVGTFWR